MYTVRSFAKSAYRMTLLPSARARLERFRKDASFPAPLTRALEKTFGGGAQGEEQRWLRTIHALREKLDSDRGSIDVVDFGAGASEGRRSEAEMQQGVLVHTTIATCSRASKDDFWGTLLFMLVREFKPVHALELGTNLGVSAAYQAAAMEMNHSGELVTLEGAPALAERAESNLASLGLERATVVRGRFKETLDEVCETHGPFDMVFIDGHHDRDATIEYFEKILPFAQPRSVFVFDDIEWSEGMKEAWDTVRAHPRVRYSLGMSQLGICILRDGGSGKTHEEISLI
jgi:predicted O-methyltransferase YrrM